MPHCFVLAALCALILVARHDTFCLPALAVTGFLFSQILPFYRGIPEPDAGGKPLKIFIANISILNDRIPELLSFLGPLNADVLALSEITPAMIPAFESLRAAYPYQTFSPATIPAGPAFFSRHPFTREKFEPRTAHIEIGLQVGGEELSVTYLPSPPPLSPATLRRRDEYFKIVAEELKGTAAPKIVVGDFNATPWTPAFKDFLSAAELRDARIGFGINPTWPDVIFPAGIAIDQCLYSAELKARGFSTTAVPGSDHRGIVCELEY